VKLNRCPECRHDLAGHSLQTGCLEDGCDCMHGVKETTLGFWISILLERRNNWETDYWKQTLLEAEKARTKVEFVQSTYRAPWQGRVIKREKRKGCGDLLTIKVVKDRHGNWLRKTFICTLDEYWTKPCKPWFDPDAPYNLDIPLFVQYQRRDTGAYVLYIRRLRKYLKRKLRGYA
jgi:hypothetical protein